MNRREFIRNSGLMALTVTAGGVLMPTCMIHSAKAQGMRRETYVTPGGHFTLSSFLFSGLELGLFRNEGIDLQVQHGQGTAGALTQVASAAAMYGVGAPVTTCPAIADRNAEMISIGQLSYPGFFEIASLPGKSLNDPKQLAGKTIGIMSQGGSTELLLDAMARKGGVDPASIKRVVTGISSSGVAFLERGQADGFFVFYETKVALQQQGVKLEYMPTDNHVVLPGDALVASTDLLKKPEGEDATVRYLRAVRKAMAFVRDPANTEKVAEWFAKYEPVKGADRKRTAAVLEQVRRLSNPPAGTPSIRMDEKNWESGLTLMEEMGAIKTRGLPRERFFTNKYIDLALKA